MNLSPKAPSQRQPWPWTASRATCAALCAAVLLTPAQRADAQEPSTGTPEATSQIQGVIELFTSQGCSSCPPADALMKTYANRKDLLVLSLPVDYWDYLGWKDTLGNPKNSERQKAYAKTRGDGQVYTPQAVINGMTHVNGASKSEIDHAIEASELQLDGRRVPIRSWVDRGSIIIETGGELTTAAAKDASKDGHDAKDKEATIWLAVVQKSVEIPITSGENRGKTLTYTNVVREMTPVGTWTGQPMRIQLARSALMRRELESIAVLIQQGKAGPIIAAAETRLW